MGAVREGLLRLSAASAAARARGWAVRWHVRLLLAAVVLAWVSSALLPLPVLGDLRGRWLPSLAAAALLVVAGLVLRLVARPWLRTPPDRLAARLDDERGWKDAAGTALEIERGTVESPLGAVLVDHAAALVASVPSAVPPAARRHGKPWLRGALVVLFLAALLLPGVDGRGGEPGAGTSGPLGAGAREERGPTEPFDADAWMRAHGDLELERDALVGVERPLTLWASLTTDRPIPEPFEGTLTLLWDEEPRADAGPLTLPRGASTVSRESGNLRAIDLASLEALKPHLTPGKHRARVRLAPTRAPFTMALVSNEVVVEVPEPDGGGGGGQPPPQPPPEPPPPAPRPEPTPEGAPEPPPTAPPPGGREEAVRPLVNEGETVKKESAVVEVEDPNAGTKPPPAVPLADALRDFERVVERAVGSERIPPRDREWLRRYFRALQGLVVRDGTPPR